MGFDWRNIERAAEAANDITRVRASVGDYGLFSGIGEALRGLDTTARAWEQGIGVATEGAWSDFAASLLEQQQRGIDEVLAPMTRGLDLSGLGAAPGVWSPSLDGLADVLTGTGLHEGLAWAVGLPEVFNYSLGLNRLIEDSLRVAAGLEASDRVYAAVWEAVPTLPLEEPFGPFGFEAYGVWTELCAGRYGAADDFMKRCLKLRPARDLEERYDRRQALWVILRSAFEGRVGELPRWMEIEDEEEAAAYLRTAIFNEVGRIRQRRKNLDKVWWKEEEMPDNFLPEEKKARKSPVREVDLPAGLPQRRAEAPAKSVRAEDPLKVVLRLESYELDDRFRALVLLYHHGTLQDRDMVSLVLKGNEPVDLAQIYGWPKVQAFQRKAQRWKVKKVGKLPLGSG